MNINSRDLPISERLFNMGVAVILIFTVLLILVTALTLIPLAILEFIIKSFYNKLMNLSGILYWLLFSVALIAILWKIGVVE